ncbi:hypothetical protein GCM10009836_35840 [Pseudonocardia ailaonensis]|uniref:Enterochelin esterase N-terminal domain-containing protein n=1 Tax=Pseudonocardia ailaonensis TaxID=367279 RepID=A0ABN2N5D0_9PSEU
MTVTHSRIAQFVSETATDPQRARDALSADLHAAGGPLVERVSPTEVDVTFVHLADEDDVQLRTALLRTSPPLLSLPMETVADGVHALTVRAASDAAVSYCFLYSPPSAGETMAEMMALYTDPEAARRFQTDLEASSRLDLFNPAEMQRDIDFGTGHARDSVLVLPDSTYDPQAVSTTTPELDELELDGRRISVYQPRGARRDDVLPLVVLVDGEVLLRGGFEHRLDHAIETGAIPPVRCVLWHNRTLTSRMLEMACDEALADELADGLLPLLQKRYGIPADRAQRVIGGFSMGGLAAVHTAFTRPDAFGSALPMSGVLWFTPDPATEAGGWLTRQIAAAPGGDTRFYLTVGSLEDIPVNAPGVPEGTTWVTAVSDLHDTLRAKGYDVRGFSQIPSGHEFINTVQAIALGLPALLTTS